MSASRLARVSFVSLSFVLTFLAVSCQVSAPQGRSEAKCVDECKVKAKARCSENACIRGCRFVLDRLMEHEGSGVVACVATGKKAMCDDAAWANCAVHVGIHADGGPPAPPESSDED